jgi:hypothetical protein
MGRYKLWIGKNLRLTADRLQAEPCTEAEHLLVMEHLDVPATAYEEQPLSPAEEGVLAAQREMAERFAKRRA